MEALQTLQEYSGLKKSEIASLAKEAIEAVLENGNPLEVAESLSAMEDFIKSVRADKRFVDYVREETIKHGKQFTSPSGAKIELAEVGSKYDFSSCNDVFLFDMEEELCILETSIKARKEFLKTVPIGGMDIRVNDELVTVYPPSKTSTSSYKISLAK